jgi:hypothetical protein
MSNTSKLLATRATDAQRATVARMKSAPAASWVVTKILGGSLLGAPLDGVAVQIEAPKLGIWGVILPNGDFMKPKPGRKTIDALDIAFKL